MSTEKLHFLKSTNIWIHRAHILHNNYLFCNRVHESHAWTQRYKDAGSLKYNFWYRSTNASVSSFAIQCQAQNGGIDKLLRRLYPLHSCKKCLLRKGWVHSRSQLRQNTKHFYDPVHPYCTTPREPPQIIYSCLVGRTSEHFQLYT